MQKMVPGTVLAHEAVGVVQEVGERVVICSTDACDTCRIAGQATSRSATPPIQTVPRPRSERLTPRRGRAHEPIRRLASSPRYRKPIRARSHGPRPASWMSELTALRALPTS